MFMFNDNNNIPHFYIQLSLTKQLFGSVHSPVHCDTVYVVFLFSAKWLAACHGEQDQGIPLKFIQPTP